jgi:hypothetical protein
MLSWLLAATVVLVTAAPEAPASEYEMVWTVFAREARWFGGESQPVAAGERSGRARARLTRMRPGVLRLDWRGDGGDGHGLIGPAGPTSFSFPSPLVITGPPPLPHLSGGVFEFSGDPERPETFTVSYVEGFICRTAPAVCSGVTMWERRFEGRATRRAAVGERHGGAGAPHSGGVSPRSTAAATLLARSLGVNGLSTTDCTPVAVAWAITSRVPCAVIITTRSSRRMAQAR